MTLVPVRGHLVPALDAGAEDRMREHQSPQPGGVDQSHAPDQRRGEDVATAKDDGDGHDGHLIDDEGSHEGER